MKLNNMCRQKYGRIQVATLFICYFLATIWSGCKQENARSIDVSKENIHVKSIRFDRALYACDTNQLVASVDQLGQTYPDFCSVFFNHLTGMRVSNNDDTFYASLKHFLTYKDLKGLMDTVNKKFPDTKKTDAALEDLFKHIHHYYPTQTYQQVYYFISGLQKWKAITIDTLVGVGLDMFLGRDYPFYASVQIPEYQTESMEARFIPVFVSKVIYEKMHPIENENKSLLDLMLQNGRELLFSEYMLPEMKEEEMIGFTPEQWKWCEDNEELIWNFFVKKNLLYSTQWQQIMPLVNEGPTTGGMPPESPGNIGSWVGWKIVKAYWKEHPEKTLQEILAMTISPQKMLEDSKYNPKK